METHLREAAPDYRYLCPPQIDYVYQGTGKTIITEDVLYDEVLMLEACRRHMAMLEGRAAPEKVCKAEEWKCNYCTTRRIAGRYHRVSQKHLLMLQLPIVVA